MCFRVDIILFCSLMCSQDLITSIDACILCYMYIMHTHIDLHMHACVNTTHILLCIWLLKDGTYNIHSFILDMSIPLLQVYYYVLLRGAPDHSSDTVSELTRRSATGNCA